MTERPKRKFAESVNHAVDGIIYAFRSERNIRIHLAIALLVLVMSLWLDLSPLEVILVFSAIVFVIITEMINTSIETILDLLTLSHHEKARVAKDVAAGAVLLSCIYALAVGYLVLYHALMQKPRIQYVFTKIKSHQTHVILLLFFVILVLILVLKALGGRGSYTSGGLFSGHAALAFAASTTILIITHNILATSLAFLIALLVAHSRVEAKVHNWLEVILGALLGIAGSLVIFTIFYRH
ncbi:MAG: diacylglycerol kinase [Candidatus Eremiobacteraeota bacterium]|nr:diacylglycerol kinase [Candidatus Eremiobacteraeota bacterium]